MSTTWTLREVLDTVKAWQPPRRCRATCIVLDDVIMLSLMRPNGCRIKRFYPKTIGLIEITDKLNIMAVDLYIDHTMCGATNKLVNELQYADIIFCEAMRRTVGWPKERRRKGRRGMK